MDANAQGKKQRDEYRRRPSPFTARFSQYSAIESARGKRYTMPLQFFSSTADAGAYEPKWDGQQYSPHTHGYQRCAE